MQKNSTAEERKRFVELWFEFARLNWDYEECCESGGAGEYASLYQLVGDIHSMSFEEWWEKYGKKLRLFDFTIFATRDESDFADYQDANDALILVVNLYAPKKVLKEKFNELLKLHHPRQGPGRPRIGDRDDVQAEVMKLRNAGADPKLTKRISYLELLLEAYRLKVSGFMSHEIAIALRINEKRSDISVPGNKKILASAANRLLRHAHQIIENVFDGEFPKYKK